MAEPTINLGGGNWAGKTDNLLGYYKEGERFYKQDFTFSRSTTGTYTDSDGYIQEMPYNLVTYSEDFSQWSTIGSPTLTSNYGQSPDGKNNSTRVQFSSGDRIYEGVNTSGDNNYSVYLKGTGTIRMRDNSGAYSNDVTLTNEWVRYDYTFNASISNVQLQQTSGTSDFEIWGAQVNKGTSAKTYFPTTTRLNMPRVDYLNNSNGSLILEPQRTNIATYSSELDNAAWTKSGTTITANNTTSPDGTTNADKIIASSGLSIKIAYQVISSTNSVAHTVSAFYKADEYSYAFLRVGGQTPSPYVIYNLLNQSVVSTANATSTKIEDYGSGWYRVSMTYTANSVTNAPNISFLPTSGYTLDSANQPSYNGDGSSGGYIYGVQLEANASYPTTLINTSGSSVTRNADACSISNVADRIGQTEGVFYWEGENIGEQFAPYLGLFADAPNTNNTRVMIYYTSETTLNTQVRLNGVIQFTSGNATANGRVKVALAYKENDFVLYVNGSKISESSSGSTFTNELNNFNFNSAICKNYDLKIYNTRLTNSELATLTTL